MSSNNLFFNQKVLRTPELIAWYDFQSSAVDSSPNGLNGSLVGSPTFTVGKVGNAVDFNNNLNSDYITISDNDKFSFVDIYGETDFSISLWFNISTINGSGNFFISKRETNLSLNEWQLLYLASSPGFSNELGFFKFSNNSGSVYKAITYPIIPTLNTWYHLVAINDSGVMKMYLNNALLSTTDKSSGTYVSMTNSTSRVSLGAILPFGSGSKNRGLVDSVGIWKNKALTASEVSQLYNSGNGISYPPPF